MITIDNISKSFKNHFWSPSFFALENVSFQLQEGRLAGFLGANGAGKSTLLKIIMGFIFQDSGEVHFSPSLGNRRQDIFRRTGFLPEKSCFHPYLSGREFLHYMGELQNLKRAKRKLAIEKFGKKLDIGYALDRKICGYSKGMLQRLGVVSALLHEPDLIILDEPLSGLDPIGRKEFKDILKFLHQEGKTIFFSSHIVPDVEEICDTVIILDKGKLIYDGPLENLYQNVDHAGEKLENIIYKIK